GAAAEAGDVAVGGEIRFLHGILGLGVVFEDRACEAIEQAVVRPHQGLECALVALTYPARARRRRAAVPPQLLQSSPILLPARFETLDEAARPGVPEEGRTGSRPRRASSPARTPNPIRGMPGSTWNEHAAPGCVRMNSHLRT